MTHACYGIGCVVATLVLACSPAVLHAQDSLPPQRTIGPPVQRIATAAALSSEPLGSITGVLELADGRVLLNDAARRRLLLMDTTLHTVSVVLDSLSEIANTYGTRAGALIPWRGDSTLFVDPASYAIVVLDPAGKPARVRSVWRVQDAPYFSDGIAQYGQPGLDAQGRVVYRIPAQAAPPRVAPPAGVPWLPTQPDSGFIVAADLDTRKIDTLGVIRVPKSEFRARRTVEGYFTVDRVFNPLPTQDDWAVLPDGRIAFVRGIDYRIDYRNADGTWTSSAKLPYDWQHLTDEDKDRLVDSVTTVQQRAALSSYVTGMIRWVNQYNRPWPAAFKVPEGFILPPGVPKDWILPPGVTFPENYIYACPPGDDPAARMAAAVTANAANTASAGAPRGRPSCVPAPVIMSGGTTPPPPGIRPVFVLAASDLPDYRPPFGPGAVRADRDGNLWIRTNLTRPTPGGPAWDIVSPQGELLTRYQLPQGYQIVGFGRGKIVYLSMRDPAGMHLARVRLK